MAVPLLTIILASASLGGGLDGAQTAYMRCLSTELDAAIVRRIDSDSFSRGVTRVCQDETAVYRRMAVASIVGQGVAGASPVAANQRFDTFDRTNRDELVASFEQRMKLRRGPSRITGLPMNGAAQHD
ncbi:hypothetical protein [Sphingomonas solaris]|uniref:Uncharacterized protein n=1 Tax=Alterirhizorhabdus solaris TaxID=2529389 RepID=A0A558QUQ1_9SPHN|nr:hypothetical protein [Sphingomonas solaris]TVV70855.1 hypothetical protein FOY91_18130 [Sphingomonas solaris]